MLQLNFKEYGNGKPIIILHGLLGMLDNWHSVANKLAYHFKVFTLDLRNHGRSPHVEQMNYRLMANDVKNFIESKHLKKVTIIGHSMGGKTAMEFANDYPDLLEALIVVDMPPGENNATHLDIFEALKKIDISRIKKRSDADKRLSPYIRDFGTRQFLLKNLYRKDDGSYHWRMNLPAIEKNYGELLRSVKISNSEKYKTLFIRGGKSDYIDLKTENEIKSLFKNVTVKTIEDAGHWVHADAPDKFVNVVNQFLKN